MTLEQSRRKTFDEVATLYDEVRPGYPEPLIEDLLTLSGTPEGGRILEAGYALDVRRCTIHVSVNKVTNPEAEHAHLPFP